MTDKITASKVGRKYLSPKDRPIVNSSNAHSLKDIVPTLYSNPNTPTAYQMMNPEVGLGEGCIRDKAPYMTVDDISPDWAEKMREAAKAGKGPTGFIVALNLTKAAFETLRQTCPEFEETYQRCLLLSCAWWEDRGRDMAMGAKGNSAVWLANMVNRWGWDSNKSVQQSTVNSTVKSTVEAKLVQQLTDEQVTEELKRRGLDKFIAIDHADAEFIEFDRNDTDESENDEL